MDLDAWLAQSWERCLQANVAPSEREIVGVQAAFRSTFPFRCDELVSLEFVEYIVGRNPVRAARSKRDAPYSASSWYVVVRLVIFDDNNGNPSIRDIKEQELFLGELPGLSPRGTLDFNGVEKVLVPVVVPASGLQPHPEHPHAAQVVLSSGVVFEIAWEAAAGFSINVRVPQSLRSVIPPSSLSPARQIAFRQDGVCLVLDKRPLGPMLTAKRDLLTASGKVIVPKGAKLTPRTLLRYVDDDEPAWPLVSTDLARIRLAQSVTTPEKTLPAGTRLTDDVVRLVASVCPEKVDVALPHDGPDEISVVTRELEHALRWLYDQHPWLEFDVGTTGAAHLCSVLGVPLSEETPGYLAPALMRALLVGIEKGTLGELRTRSTVMGPGERLAGAIFSGLLHVAEATIDRIASSNEIETLMPHDLLDSSPVNAAIRALLTDPNACVPFADFDAGAWSNTLREVPRDDSPVRLELP